MENFLNSGSQKPDLSKLAGAGSLYAKQFVTAQFSEISNDNQFSDEINRFFKIFPSMMLSSDLESPTKHPG